MTLSNRDLIKLSQILSELLTEKYKEKAFAFDEIGKQRRIEVIQIGKEIGKNVFTTKGGRGRNPDADPFVSLFLA